MSAPEGVWLTFDASEKDAETVNAFRSEIAALRHALENGHTVTFVKWGESIGDVELRKWHDKKAAEKAEATK